MKYFFIFDLRRGANKLAANVLAANKLAANLLANTAVQDRG